MTQAFLYYLICGFIFLAIAIWLRWLLDKIEDNLDKNKFHPLLVKALNIRNDKEINDVLNYNANGNYIGEENNEINQSCE